LNFIFFEQAKMIEFLIIFGILCTGLGHGKAWTTTLQL